MPDNVHHMSDGLGVDEMTVDEIAHQLVTSIRTASGFIMMPKVLVEEKGTDTSMPIFRVVFDTIAGEVPVLMAGSEIPQLARELMVFMHGRIAANDG